MLDSFNDLIVYADRISDRVTDPIYILSATSVAHTYCRNHADCDQNAAIKKMVDYLEENILKRINESLPLRAQRDKACILFINLVYV